jgi:hypothetical protein
MEPIRTDLQIKLPGGCYGRIAPRTDLALDHHIDIGAGVIDQDFRGNLQGMINKFRDGFFTQLGGHFGTPLLAGWGSRTPSLPGKRDGPSAPLSPL